MKITVIADAKGNVVGSMSHSSRKTAGSPTITIEVEKGQQLHEVDIDTKPVKSTDDLHKLLQKSITSKTRV